MHNVKPVSLGSIANMSLAEAIREIMDKDVEVPMLCPSSPKVRISG